MCEKTALERSLNETRDPFYQNIKEVYEKNGGRYAKLLQQEKKARVAQKFPEGLLDAIDYTRIPLEERYTTVIRYINDLYKEFEDKWGFFSYEKIFGRSARDEIDPDLERGMTTDYYKGMYPLPYKS